MKILSIISIAILCSGCSNNQKIQSTSNIAEIKKLSLQSNTQHQHIENNDNRDTLIFWSDSVPIETFLNIIADISGNKLVSESPLSKSIRVKYLEETHWKKILNDLSINHQLSINIDNTNHTITVSSK